MCTEDDGDFTDGGRRMGPRVNREVKTRSGKPLVPLPETGVCVFVCVVLGLTDRTYQKKNNFCTNSLQIS